MIQIKTFSVEDSEKANAFMRTHYPTGKDGIILHHGRIVIFYEDGMPQNEPAEVIANLKNQLGAENEKLLAAEIDVAYWQKVVDELWQGKPTDAVRGDKNQLLIAKGNRRQIRARIRVLKEFIADGLKLTDEDSDQAEPAE